METFVTEMIRRVFSVVDIPFVLGIVFVIQMLKKVITLKKKKLWVLFLIPFGFLAAFLKINPFEIKLFLIQGFIYIAACELVYQLYHYVMKKWANKKG
jgi:hypothetical protein